MGALMTGYVRGKSKLESRVSAAIRLRQEITAARLDRREVLKLASAAAGSLMLGGASRSALAKDIDLISPPSAPFVQPFTRNCDASEEGCEVTAEQFAAHGGGRPEHDTRRSEWRRKHQYSNAFAPRRHFIIPLIERNDHIWHPTYGPDVVWGFLGELPGPCIRARYGEPIAVRFTNELPLHADRAFGVPQLITHLHNFHSASESDGGPWGYYDQRAVAEPLGQPWFRDHHYTMARAGFTDPRYSRYYEGRSDYSGGLDGNWGDPAETLGTLWYHSHRPDFTTANVYRGQVGFFTAYDELDTGEETTGLCLPSGVYDQTMSISDRVFDGDGKSFFDVFELDGILGDKPVVNGKVQPYMDVDRRRYRFRLLCLGPSRILQLHLYNATQRRWVDNAFLQISNDGNLLPHGVPRSGLFMAVAERFDVLVDFARIGKTGDRIVMYNRLEQVNGNKPSGKLLAPGIPILQFRVGGIVPDASFDYFANPGRMLRPPAVFSPAEAVRRRLFRFGRTGGQWAVNGEVWDPSIRASQAMPKRNTAEIWTLENGSGGWVHPAHVHYEEGRILSRNGVAPPVHERGRKDVFFLGENQTAELFLRFRDFPQPDFDPPNPAYKAEAGRYVMHCHNTVHEDHAMMVRFDVVP